MKTLLVIAAIACSFGNIFSEDPDDDLTTCQLVSNKGYPCQEYNVTTTDGYILRLHRIPHGRNSSDNATNSIKPIAFLQHGLVDSSATWVLNFPNQSLGFLMADAGYDVWMGNVRGNIYSRASTKYNAESDDFWNFTFDEMAKYDIPAMIDYVLNSTGQQYVYYVGHSQGTLVGFIEFSQNPIWAKAKKMNRIESLKELVSSRKWVENDNWIPVIYEEIKALRALGYNIQIDNDEFWEKVVQTLDVSKFYTIQPMEPTHIKRFRATGRSYTINFETFGKNTNLLNIINGMITDIINTALATAEEGDIVGLEINHPSLENPIIIPFRKRDLMTAELILNLIERVAQSKKDLSFNNNDPMSFKFIIFSPAGGEGRVKKADFANIKEWHMKKSYNSGSILKIQNDDKFCCARALVTAKAYVDQDKQYEVIAKGDRGYDNSEQKRRALELRDSAGLEGHTGGCGVNELQKFQTVLKDYQIIVITKDYPRTTMFEGPANSKRFILFFHEDHYDVIKSMKGFMSSVNWCFKCKVGYSNKDKHICERGDCYCCNQSPLCELTEWILCPDCGRYFRSEQCFKNHQDIIPEGSKMDPLCKRLYKCKDCNGIIKRYNASEHYCGKYKCKNCKAVVVKGEKHLCYMQQMSEEDYLKKLGKLKPTFIFFDIETRQDETNEKGEHIHKPNLIMAEKVCEKCRNTNKECPECGVREQIFKGDDCLKRFCKWLFSEENHHSTVITHNLKGFDGQFILDYVHDEGNQKPTIINRGLKIMLLEVANSRLINSINFLPMALAAMPKTFGFTELKKGYFPHFFNTKANEEYIGVVPSPEHYGPDNMKEEDREAFFKWYESQKDQQFNMAEDIVAYCRSDVRILRQCSLSFRDIFIQKNGVDPFLASITIASACNVVYRKNFLQTDTIGLIPNDNYCSAEKQSAFALKYLLWEEKKRNTRIQHKMNGGEKRIGSYKVDGFLEPNICIEVYGCYFHGCQKCFDPFQKVNGGYTSEELHMKTLDRKNFLQNKGYTIEEHWECEIREQLEINKEMKKFFKETKVDEPLNPRDAFYGGRTNSLKLYHKCAEGEEIAYVDVCSLYPYICKYGAFPVGHPTVITTPDMDKIENRVYFGLIKCSVVPPKRLQHPVLPLHVNDKLMFVLCRTCAEKEEDSCTHTAEERTISGTWTHFELYKAMDEGYKVTNVEAVWHYEKTAIYDPKTKTGGLFAKYINTFLKIKQESDGFPAGVITEDQKREYIAKYKEVEGIELDINKIEKNSGLRALSKLSLNSFWGKFGQRNNLGKTIYITEPSKLFELFDDSTKIVTGLNFYGDSMVSVVVTDIDDAADIMTNTNVVIAAMVTSQARLKLYSYMEKLQERCLYVDTDSVIYLTRPTDTYRLPLGNYLGCLTNELKAFGEDARISEFVGAGPKNYAYIVTNKKGEILNQTVKARGFTLDFVGKKTVNFDVMKSMVHDFVVYNREVYNILCQSRICVKPDRSVVTKLCKKSYGIVYNKRYINDDFTTLPYGYGN